MSLRNDVLVAARALGPGGPAFADALEDALFLGPEFTVRGRAYEVRLTGRDMTLLIRAGSNGYDALEILAPDALTHLGQLTQELRDGEADYTLRIIRFSDEGGNAVDVQLVSVSQ